MDRRTKEMIHDAIARQLSSVFPAVDLEIITEVVDAQVPAACAPSHHTMHTLAAANLTMLNHAHST
jgi:hypothetical protein